MNSDPLVPAVCRNVILDLVLHVYTNLSERELIIWKGVIYFHFVCAGLRFMSACSLSRYKVVKHKTEKLVGKAVFLSSISFLHIFIMTLYF